MPFDAHANLAIATVTSATGAAGTTLTVALNEGARFPAPPFNATVWPNGVAPTPLNAEIVRVTARAADTLTIVRTQEGTTAHAIILGDLIAATITKQWMTDVESGVNFPQLGTTGNVALLNPTGATVGLTTAAGSDTGYLQFRSGGGDSARCNLFGNQSAIAGRAGGFDFIAGDTPTGTIDFKTGPEVVRGRIYPSGGFSWGGTTDPGTGVLRLGNGATGTLDLTPSATIVTTTLGTGLANIALFSNANGLVGYIQTSGSTTTYGTSSDARLKTDRGRLTDPDVLRRTVIHKFTWTADGTPGRGVFAQEAAAVAPFAVTVGTDERDDDGRLTHPWGVDYSKYVPDLIVGWQQHDALVESLQTRLAMLEAQVTNDSRQSWVGQLYQRLRTQLTQWWTPVEATP